MTMSPRKTAEPYNPRIEAEVDKLVVLPEVREAVDAQLAGGNFVDAVKVVYQMAARPSGYRLAASKRWVERYIENGPRTLDVVAAEIVAAHKRLVQLYAEYDRLAAAERQSAQ
jgi:hypothetical protein